ncbi:MAG: YebC/PmpR family DNA-binding transcriptional regulator [Desulfobacula sp.]|jgi:YebC/PmpR family DNA-binding regulatory protein|uniref:YebC/PmpR family DNA-binding transcriptional regulator n=1 Tax=Desulfobacula sp. TaxID=2593537 RepID=UPI001D6C07BF|nr:YebC/PmpR family DNA-binding transcriptional regulator [Desulfobacula sp.]MBT3486382.1 YebC/PmpR family DNA-binding transcriptional regulator [Desulfobacula sp.]MBT3805358.1 YebC/PmpR family DNA-binding transcriptional regulator [Desulfobacula sp.]MBT4024512.1 YebC/PmpR family DNA-binding transcriptional regulator [Desulfobacula sp.]MBT4199828.1 YebC/PmpR family DNA-binding transcriptional regulator [Desulfobacula sp.]
MSGHSKWSTIKHKKGATDAKRGKIFTKIIKEITVAARMGGGDPETNPRLRSALISARSENMPKDTFERAIKKGTGDLEGVDYEEILYEGYGPGGVAVLVECLTDNRNRTIAEVRQVFNKAGGNVGTDGCVAWMFDKKGLIIVNKEDSDEETLMELALDAGAEDIKEETQSFEIICEPADFEAVKETIDAADIKYEMAEITMIPQNMTKVEGKDAEQMINFMDAMDDCDDIQKFYSNADIPDEAFDAM